MASASFADQIPTVEPIPVDAPAAQPAPKPRKCCGTCRDWRPSHMRPSVGQCMPGSSQAPLMTIDLAVCSDHKWREGL